MTTKEKVENLTGYCQEEIYGNRCKERCELCKEVILDDDPED